MEWTFTIEGPPKPWERSAGRGKRRFKPKGQAEYQERVKLAALVAGVKPLAGPVEIIVHAYLDSRSAAHLYGSGDWDNYAKQVCDALNGTAYNDDCQIVRGEVHKRIGQARMEVCVKGSALAYEAKEPEVIRKPRLGMNLAPSYVAPNKKL